MEVKDLVKFNIRHVADRSAPLTGMTVIGQIMAIDESNTLADVREVFAASIWGVSDGGNGEMHLVELTELTPYWEAMDEARKSSGSSDAEGSSTQAEGSPQA